MTTETKSFHIGDVLSVTSGFLVSPDHIGGVYNILGWMTGQDLMTHQLSRVSRECEPLLRETFPELTSVAVPPIDSWEACDAWLRTLYPVFGEHVEVPKLEAVDHTVIDPIAEVKMIRPDLPIIGLDA